MTWTSLTDRFAYRSISTKVTHTKYGNTSIFWPRVIPFVEPTKGTQGGRPLTLQVGGFTRSVCALLCTIIHLNKAIIRMCFQAPVRYYGVWHDHFPLVQWLYSRGDFHISSPRYCRLGTTVIEPLHALSHLFNNNDNERTKKNAFRKQTPFLYFEQVSWRHVLSYS